MTKEMQPLWVSFSGQRLLESGGWPGFSFIRNLNLSGQETALGNSWLCGFRERNILNESRNHVCGVSTGKVTTLEASLSPTRMIVMVSKQSPANLEFLYAECFYSKWGALLFNGDLQLLQGLQLHLMDVNLLISGSPASPLGWMEGAPQPSWVLWGGKSLVGVDGAWPGRSCPTFHTGVCASLPCFLRSCVCGVSSLRASVAYFLRACLSGAFPPFVGLWPVFSKRASVAFPPSMRLWHFFRPRVSGVSFVRASVALFLPPCVCGAFLPSVRLWSVSFVHASVVFSPSVDLWRFLCESVTCFLRPRWRPSLLSSHHLLIAPCVLSLCQACGVCHLCGRGLRDTQGHTLGEP